MGLLDVRDVKVRLDIRIGNISHQQRKLTRNCGVQSLWECITRMGGVAGRVVLSRESRQRQRSRSRKAKIKDNAQEAKACFFLSFHFPCKMPKETRKTKRGRYGRLYSNCRPTAERSQSHQTTPFHSSSSKSTGKAGQGIERYWQHTRNLSSSLHFSKKKKRTRS